MLDEKDLSEKPMFSNKRDFNLVNIIICKFCYFYRHVIHSYVCIAPREK